MMNWTSEISSVGPASRASEEELREEIKMFQTRVDSISEKVFDEADEELQKSAGEFLKVGKILNAKLVFLHINTLF